MNKRERALRAMKSLPVDHVPSAFFRHMFREDANGKQIWLTIEEQIQWLKDSRIDLICLENDGYEEYPMELPTGTVRDFKNIPRFSAKDSFFGDQINRVNRIIDALKGERAVTYLIYPPFSMLKHILKSETRIMEYWKEDKQTILDAMAVMEEVNYTLLRRLKEETGVDGAFVSLQNAEIGRFPKEEYQEYLTRWDVSMIAHAKHFFDANFFHLCSWLGVPNQMDLWKDYEYGCVHWGVHIENELNLRQARDFFRKGTAIMGGFDNRPQSILYNGTEQEVKDYTKALIDSAGDIGYIISADCSIQGDIPIERFGWIEQAAEEYAET